MERKGSCIFGMMAGRFVVGRSVGMVADYVKDDLCVVEEGVALKGGIFRLSPKWLGSPC